MMEETKKRDLEGQVLTRSEVVDFVVSEDERSVEFPFSSETPVNRGYLGNEILVHREDSIDFSRLNSSAPLLLNHDVSKVIGVVERGWLDSEKRQGRVKVRFANNALGKETLEMVNDKIYRNVSFGYSVEETEEADNGSYRVTKFSPAEISLVSVPADFSIGLGRAIATQKEEPSNMPEERSNDASIAAPVAPPKPPTPKVDMTTTPEQLAEVRAEVAADAAKAERSRISGITALARQHGFEELGAQLVEKGSSIDEARAVVLEKIGAKPVETVKPVELDEKQQERYSIVSGVRAALTGDWSSREAGFVRELSQEVERSGLKRSAERSFFVPFSALSKRATYVTSGATTGGNLVATDLYADDFIEALRNSSKMMSLGVKALPGLVGDVAIPRRSGVAATYYLSSETTAITQAESTFDQVTMTPKNLAALSKYSRQTLLTATPGIEELIRTDLTDGLNTAVDLGILNGSGSSGQPTGVMQTSGIGSVAIGTNGGAITIEKLVDLEEQVLIDNGAVSDSLAYITNAKVLAELKKLRAGGSAAGDGSFLWNTDPASVGRGGTPGTVNGYPLAVTNQVPSNLTKGSSSSVCSAVVFGDFSQATVGFWGSGLEITVGEESDDFAKALTSVRGIITYDVAVRHAESFAACLDVTT